MASLMKYARSLEEPDTPDSAICQSCQGDCRCGAVVCEYCISNVQFVDPRLILDNQDAIGVEGAQ